MNLAERFRKLIVQRQIIKSMAVKNLKDKYVGSVLGISWAIINPVLIMLAVTLVFTRIMKTGMRHFPLLVLSALLPWFSFIHSISESTGSMKQNVGVLSQFVILREAIPVSIALANFINFLFGFIVMLPVFIIFNPAIIKFLWLLPFIMLLHFIFTLGISVFFSIVNVYFKDLSQLLNVGIMFLFWLTPIFYPLEMVPPTYRWLILANPGTCYVVIYRALLYRASHGSAYMWMLAVGFALISIIGGYVFFVKKEANILKYV